MGSIHKSLPMACLESDVTEFKRPDNSVIIFRTGAACDNADGRGSVWTPHSQSRELHIFLRRLTARAAYLAMEHDSLRARWLSLAASILLCLIAGVAYAFSLYCFRPSPWREPPRAVATYDDAETRARYQSSDCAKRDPWPRAGLHCP